MNEVSTSSILFTLFPIFGFLFAILPIIFFVWFAIATIRQLKMQTTLLEEIKDRLKRE